MPQSWSPDGRVLLVSMGAAAGGIDARLEAPIDGRTVFVTSCVQALRTYHVWIQDQHLLISASSVGDGRFGELLMGELRV